MMFGTSIHWTTFFYLLVDSAIVLLAIYFSKKTTHKNLKRFISLGLLFVAYNVTGGLLPTPSFPGPIIVQYIITYGIAIALCVYIVYYLYKEYDIVVLKFNSSVKNLAIVSVGSYVLLYLTPYYFTNSLIASKYLFNIPISILTFTFLVVFYRRISNPKKTTPIVLRRNKLSLMSASSIALLPVMTAIGDYQWLTFSVMNLAFYAITAIEIDRYLYILAHQNRMYEVFALNKRKTSISTESKIVYEDLTRREIEIALGILGNLNYKKIAEDLFIAESTVSKHASNIFKKTGVKNKRQFISRFKKKSIK